MAATVTISQQWDSSLGQTITATTISDLAAYPTPPSDAYDVQQSVVNGLYSVSYKELGSASMGANIEVQSSCSSEPLITHPMFAAGGAKDLTSATLSGTTALQAISFAESDPGNKTTGWQALITNWGATSPVGWYAQFQLWGIADYENPKVTLHVTLVESAIIDLSTVRSVYTTSFKGVTLPSLPESANYMLMGGSSRSLNATRWRNSYELKGSGMKGWSSSLYTYATGGSNPFGF